MKRLLGVLMMMSAASFIAMGTQSKQADPKMQMMQDCPMSVTGAELAVADTTTGIALTLTTKTGSVDELRHRAERMAAMHSSSAEKPSPMPESMMSGNAKYEAIPNGARLTLTPKDPGQLSDFRKQVRSRVEHMKSMESGCSSMHEMMNGMMGGMGKPTSELKPDPKKDDSGVDHSAHHPDEKP